MRDFSIISVSMINLYVGVRYCYLTYRKEIKPALAMWVFFTIAVAVSLTTYMAKDDFTLMDNILNTTDLLSVGAISIFVFFFGDKSSKFTQFDKACLLAVLLIVVFWFITKTHLLSHLLVQVIMVISYFPVIRRLWQSKENTEPFSIWFLMMINPILSLISSKGELATIYSVRAIACTGLLILLMLRVEYLAKQEKVKG